MFLNGNMTSSPRTWQCSIVIIEPRLTCCSHHELTMVLRRWKLKRDRPRPVAASASGPSRIVFPPISAAMPGPVNSNYLQHRAVQEAGVWLLAACSRLCHATSTQDVANDHEAHFVANFLLKEYALPYSAGVYPCPEKRQSLAGARVETNTDKLKRIIRAWLRPFRLLQKASNCQQF